MVINGYSYEQNIRNLKIYGIVALFVLFIIIAG